jgi:diaminohydroxyphosphoribosylaminopyrimidine deaminase/5-amino-6-(5-phosphoribosylamino)uracil reductase
MRRALALAHHGWGQTAPNPLVGAVVVAGETVVGEGFHARFGGPHAEVVALADAGDRAAGATVFVTLEPCAHHGKTPPCTDALIAARVARVVAAVRDPSPVARGGVEKLRAAGIDVELGVEREAALELNAPFFNAVASERPWITLKLAMSADGAIADASRQRRWLTGDDARREVHHLRAGVDAIAVGIGTALADDPSLTVRDVPPPRIAPRRVVFDSTLRLPLDSVLARTARDIPTIAVARRPDPARARALSSAGVLVIAADTIEQQLHALRSMDIRAMLVEGGARLAGSLLEASAVDRLIIFQAPTMLGMGALRALAYATPDAIAAIEQAPVLGRRAMGDDVMTIHALRPVPCSPD